MKQNIFCMRILSAVLSIIICISFISFEAYAENTEAALPEEKPAAGIEKAAELAAQPLTEAAASSGESENNGGNEIKDEPEATEPAAEEQAPESEEQVQDAEANEITELYSNVNESFAGEASSASNAELEEYFAERILYGLEPAGTYAFHDGSTLTENGLAIYDKVYSFISGVAENGGSTVMELNRQNSPFLANFKGTAGKDDFFNTLDIVCRKIHCEYPECLYWSKGALCIFRASMSSQGEEIIRVSVEFMADPEYCSGGSDTYVDASKIQRAIKARNNAAAFAQQIAGSGASDWDKILAAADKIKSLTEYNTEAVGGSYSPLENNDPWSIVNVFACDGGENRVVCEGYAKSFQYLFDLIFPDGRQQCYCVSNNNHMWNIVRYNGAGYFTDVTYYDGGWDTIMISPENGKVRTEEPGRSYTVLCANETRSYSEETLNSYGSEVLTLAEKPAAPEPVAVDAEHFPDAQFRQYVLDVCDTDGDGILSSAELSALSHVDVQGRNIGSLKGIEYFKSLIELNCSGNRLTGLDLSRNSSLRSLSCSGNSFEIADGSPVTELKDFDVSMLRESSGGNFNGGTVNFDSGSGEINYRYYCGANQYAEFRLIKKKEPCDINSDGKADVMDMILLMKGISGETAAPGAELDINSDGSADVMDLIALMKFISG